MNSERIQHLLLRQQSGEITSAERAELERLIAEGEVSLSDVRGFGNLLSQVDRLSAPEPSPDLDRRFYAMLAAEQKRSARGWRWNAGFLFPFDLAPKLAWASAMLIVGMAAGYFLRPPAAGGEEKIEMLSQQVTDLKEMMMLSMLETGSATERLKAVNLTHEMDEASRKVTTALIQTLNYDDNINVRLAALEALKPYAADSGVRESLIKAIARQESPLVQIALAELMVALQEKSAIKEFEKIVESEKTPSEVRRRLKESIETLI